MSGRTDGLDETLDRAIGALRDESPAGLEGSAARAWSRVTAELADEGASGPASPTGPEHLAGCEDFRALFGTYLAGELAPGRRLLVDDHLRHCVGCRAALKARRSGLPVGPALAVLPAEAGARPGGWRQPRATPLVRAMAAAVVLALVLAGLVFAGSLLAPAPVLAHSEAPAGALLSVTDRASRAVAAGAPLRAGERLRTPKGAGALLRLTDGSVLELRERSELSLTRAGDGTTVRLTRGAVVVQAAPQGSGHLYVQTEDCRVAVTGTTFAVNHGTKGSRVSVIQGEVEVSQAGEATVLAPGDQLTTRPGLAPVPVAEDIAWSRNVDDYIAVLGELNALDKAVQARVPRPGLRYESPLLDAVPEGTVLYAALPNLSDTLRETDRLLRERLATSDVLRRWWEREVAPADQPDGLSEAVQEATRFGALVGDELVVAVQADEAGHSQGPVLLATVPDAARFRATLQERLADAPGAASDGVALHFVEQSAAALAATTVEAPVTEAAASDTAAPDAPGKARDGDGLWIWLDGDRLTVAPGLASLRAVAAGRVAGGGAFRRSAFGARLAEAYRDGVSWLLGVDLRRLAAVTGEEEPASASGTAAEPDPSGFQDADYLIVEQRELGETTESRGVLSFDQPRRGVAAWLAAPAPMGTLDFVSPEAYLVSAFVVKSPATLVDDLAPFFPGDTDAPTEAGRAILTDLAATMGGEMAVAVDGPVLPEPAWKMVVEVYDPVAFQAAIERSVARLNGLAQAAGKRGLALESSSGGGRTTYTLRALDGPLAVHYTFAYGYLVAAPEKGLLERALQYHDSGFTLAGAPAFRALLPQDGELDFSAILYQNVKPVLGPLVTKLAHSEAALSSGQGQALAALGTDLAPSLAYAYAEPERIVFASSGGRGLTSLNLNHLIGIGAFAGLQEALGAAVEDGGK